MTPILNLPTDIYILICARLRTRHISRLTQTCHDLYSHLTPILWATATADNSDKRRLGHFAARTGNLTLLVKLITEYDYIPIEPRVGKSPLKLAATNSHVAVVCYLLSYYPVGTVPPPLITAASRNDVPLLRAILAHESYRDRVSPKDRHEALVSATEYGSLDAARELLLLPLPRTHGGGLLDISGSRSYAVLKYAVQGKRGEELLRLLLEHGADVNRSGVFGTVLMVAAARGRVWAMEMLLERGADVNVVDSEGRTVLHRVIGEGGDHIKRKDQVRMVAVLLGSGGCDLEMEDERNRTAMGLAIEKGAFGIVRLLLDDGAAVVGDGKNAVLRLAVAAGHVATVNEMLDMGADVNTRGSGWSSLTGPDGSDWSPVDHAAWSGKTGMLSLLVERGAVVDAGSKDGRRTALHLALGRGHVEAARWLVEHGAEVASSVGGDHPWKSQLLKALRGRESTETSLHFAALGGKECFQFVLEAGLQRDTESILSLLRVAREGAKGREQVKEEGDEEEEEEEEEEKGVYVMPELTLAVGDGSPEEDLYRMILALGRGSADDSFDAVHWLLWPGDLISEGIIRAVFEYVGSTIDISRPEVESERTLLHHSAIFGDVKITKLLLEMGAEPDMGDDEDRTPLYYAAENLKVETVQLLLERGARAEREEWEYSPLAAALVYNYSPRRLIKILRDDTTRQRLDAIVDALVAHGADLNKVWEDGEALLCMMMNDIDDTNLEIAVEYLLRRGVDVNQVDKDGKTALHHAAWKDWPVVIQMLLDWGADPQLKDSKGKTALQGAEELYVDRESVDILIRHMYQS